MLISVIIPTYNHCHLIKETLNSIFLQTYRHIEIIVVDDGSIDDTFNSIAVWKEQMLSNSDIIFKYIYQENKGAPSARNIGLVNSHGEFIQFVDSDDLLDRKKFENAIDIMIKKNDIDFVYSLRNDIDSKGVEKPWNSIIANLEKNLCASEVAINSVFTALPVFRRKVICLAGPWNEKLTCHQDWEYFARVVMVSNRAVNIPIAQAFCRNHEGERISKGKLGDEKGIISYSLAIRSIYDLVFCESESQQKHLALKKLRQRCLSCIRVSIAFGNPQLAKSIASDNKIMFKRTPLLWKYFFWLALSNIPPTVLFKLFTPIRLYKSRMHETT